MLTPTEKSLNRTAPRRVEPIPSCLMQDSKPNTLPTKLFWPPFQLCQNEELSCPSTSGGWIVLKFYMWFSHWSIAKWVCLLEIDYSTWADCEKNLKLLLDEVTIVNINIKGEMFGIYGLANLWACKIVCIDNWKQFVVLTVSWFEKL